MIDVIKQSSSVITAAAVILGLGGYIAKPHAEQFVQDSVQQMVQQKIDTLDVKLRHVERELKESTKTGESVKTKQEVILDQQRLILQLLRRRQP